MEAAGKGDGAKEWNSFKGNERSGKCVRGDKGLNGERMRGAVADQRDPESGAL